MNSIESSLRITGNAISLNIIFALVKILTGIVGNSYALIADGLESTMDVVSSLMVWGGLRISIIPPDKNHPYGHGKAESLAGVVVALSLLLASLGIAIQSIREIRNPQAGPEWYTLAILLGIIIAKEILFRKMIRIGQHISSRAIQNDAWHQRSDALTSSAAFFGILIALVGGEGYEVADDWAALFATVIILVNGIRLLLPALNEIMDAAPPDEIEDKVRTIASKVEGVISIEKCRIRKSGLGLLMDIHVIVHGDISVRAGHKIGHEVKNSLINSDLHISDVTVHVEPESFSD
jgi:cation diffusion facilitator family transporter